TASRPIGSGSCTPASTTSSRCVIGSTPGGSSETGTWSASSAPERMRRIAAAQPTCRVACIGWRQILRGLRMEWLWPVLIVLGVLVLAGIYLWSTYNSLVQLNVRVDEAWSGITVQLKRRADLIPNLIETVRGYAAHEKAVFEGVTRARAETLSA